MLTDCDGPRHDLLGGAQPEGPHDVRGPWLRPWHGVWHPVRVLEQDRDRLGELGGAVLGPGELVGRVHVAEDEARYLHADS